MSKYNPHCGYNTSHEIHTEEKFGWSKAHDRSATGVEHMQHIDRAQRLFDEFDVVPNYVVDYPIASR